MASVHEEYTEDQLQNLIACFAKMSQVLVRPIETSPSEGFMMGKSTSDEYVPLREAVWETMKDLQSEIFPIRLPWYHQTVVEFSHSSEIGRQLFVNACYDPNDFYILEQFLEEGMTFLDVGANIGLYSLFASTRIGSSGRVIAFEPSRREAGSFERNVALNRCLNVQLLPLAVGDKSGKATLSVADPNFDGHNTIGALALRRNTNIRYTTDGREYHWTSFAGRKTQLPIGKASQIEILIYSDSKLDLLLNDVTFEPQSSPTGPWAGDERSLKLIELPYQFADRFSGADMSAFGPLMLKNEDGALHIEANAGAGVAFRWTLDPEVETLVTIDGSPRAEAPVDTYTVDIISLDELMAKHQKMKVDILKIDVEGHELAVLEGARALIERQQPLLLVEIANDLLTEKEVDASDIAQFLHSMNYILFDVVKGEPRLIDVKGDHGSNVFAVPEKHLDKMLSLGGLTRDDLVAGIQAAKEVEEQEAQIAEEEGAVEEQVADEEQIADEAAEVADEGAPVQTEADAAAEEPSEATEHTADPAGETADGDSAAPKKKKQDAA